MSHQSKTRFRVGKIVSKYLIFEVASYAHCDFEALPFVGNVSNMFRQDLVANFKIARNIVAHKEREIVEIFYYEEILAFLNRLNEVQFDFKFTFDIEELTEMNELSFRINKKMHFRRVKICPKNPSDINFMHILQHFVSVFSL